MASKKFPKTVYIKHDGDDNADWLVADEKIFNLGEMGVKTRVGVYTLTEVVEIEGIVSQRKVKK